MQRVCLVSSNSSLQYLERSLLLLVRWLQGYESVHLNFVLFPQAYPSTNKNDVEPCCHKQDSLMRLALCRPSTAINKCRREVLCPKLIPRLTVQQSSITKPDIGRKTRFLTQLLGVHIGILPQRLIWKNKHRGQSGSSLRTGLICGGRQLTNFRDVYDNCILAWFFLPLSVEINNPPLLTTIYKQSN